MPVRRSDSEGELINVISINYRSLCLLIVRRTV
nr:MAG TPA: hypothetical protein [Caudoviricetes sp.]